MKDLTYFPNIYFCLEPVDFRKQANGLAQLVGSLFGKKLDEQRSLFIFRNKGAKAIRMLYWDSTGVALWSKKLEKDSFKWPKKGEKPLKLKASEVKMILQGVDINKINKHEPTKFSETA